VTYSLYCTDVPLQSKYMPDVRSLVAMNFETKDAAIGAACALIKAGNIVWQIRGPDGDVMQRGAIEVACQRRDYT
jgi:hypothetical protein